MENATDESAELEERRRIRQEYREIRDLIHQYSHDFENVTSTEFHSLHERVNQLYPQVSNVRELGIDAEALVDLANGLHSQACKMGDISSKLTFESFAVALQRCFHADAEHGGQFSWSRLSTDVGCLFTHIPSFSVLYGPLAREPRVRKQRSVRTNATQEEEEAQPDEIVQDGNAQSRDEEATNVRCQNLHKAVMTKSKNGPFDLIQLLVDPEDAVQTIENFFDFSFLIKDKRASFHLNTTTGTLESAATLQEEFADSERKQRVLSLNMKQVKELMAVLTAHSHANGSDHSPANSSTTSTNKERLSLDSVSSGGSNRTDEVFPAQTSLGTPSKIAASFGCPLHRKDPLYQARTAREQADILQERASRRAKNSKKRKSVGDLVVVDKSQRSDSKSQSSRVKRKGSQTQDISDSDEEEKEEGNIVYGKEGLDDSSADEEAMGSLRKRLKKHSKSLVK